MAKGVSREQLAVDLDVSISALWSIENLSNHNPSIKLIIKLANFYGVKLSELVDTEKVHVEKPPGDQLPITSR